MAAVNPTIVVVGAGLMGRMSIELIAEHSPSARFRVIDRSAEALSSIAASLGDRVETVQGDLHSDGLAAEIAGDLVANFAGPFYSGSNAVAKAALAKRVPYVDICDDAEGTRAILALDAAAKEAGIPIVTGAGNSPGMSNVLARVLLQREPAIDGIRVVWVVREDNPGGLAPLRHMLHMAAVPCPVWDNGQATESAGFTPITARVHLLPKPVGEVTAFDTSHPEPITLPVAFPGLRHVSCQGTLLPKWSNDTFSMLGRLGFGDPALRVEVGGTEVDPSEVLWKVLWARHKARPEVERDCVTVVQVQGLVGDDIRATATIRDDHSMVRTTGIGAATAILSMLEQPVSAGAWGTEALEPQRALEIFHDIASTAGAIPDGIVFEHKAANSDS